MELVCFVPSTDVATPHAATRTWGASFIWPLDRRSYAICGSSKYRGLIRLDEDTSLKIALCGLLGVAAMERPLAAILAADAQGELNEEASTATCWGV